MQLTLKASVGYGDFFYKDAGVLITTAGASFDTDPEMIALLAKLWSLRALVNAGNVIVNNGAADLSAADGLKYLVQLWLMSGNDTSPQFTHIEGSITDTQHGSRGGAGLHPAATTTVAGFMSPTDKTKLDGIVLGKGNAFPGTPSDGDLFYRTDLDHLFRYDADRGKWLGELETEGGGRNGALVSNTYFRRFDGMAYSAALGVQIPWDMTVVGITWAMSAGVAGTIEVRRNGAVVASKATGAAASGSDMTLNGDFASAGVFAIFWNSGNIATDPQIRVYFRRRAT